MSYTSEDEETILGPDDDKCIFCKQGDDTDFDLYFGKLHEFEETKFTHLYCLFFSSNLTQKGEDTDGIEGFLVEDIQKEVKRAKQLRCVFCKGTGASIGCEKKRCKQSYHFQCGRDNRVLLRYGKHYNSLCRKHFPEQRYPQSGMQNEVPLTECPFCKESIPSSTSYDILTTPCCDNTFFHRECIQRKAKQCTLKFLKCPNCKNKQEFQEEMIEFGIDVPEPSQLLSHQEPNEQNYRCGDDCHCPKGKTHSRSSGQWQLIPCQICESAASHRQCGGLQKSSSRWKCSKCSGLTRVFNVDATHGGIEDTNQEEGRASMDEGPSTSGQNGEEDDSDSELPALYDVSAETRSSIAGPSVGPPSKEATKRKGGDLSVPQGSGSSKPISDASGPVGGHTQTGKKRKFSESKRNQSPPLPDANLSNDMPSGSGDSVRPRKRSKKSKTTEVSEDPTSYPADGDLAMTRSDQAGCSSVKPPKKKTEKSKKGEVNREPTLVSEEGSSSKIGSNGTGIHVRPDAKQLTNGRADDVPYDSMEPLLNGDVSGPNVQLGRKMNPGMVSGVSDDALTSLQMSWKIDISRLESKIDRMHSLLMDLCGNISPRRDSARFGGTPSLLDDGASVPFRGNGYPAATNMNHRGDHSREEDAGDDDDTIVNDLSDHPDDFDDTASQEGVYSTPCTSPLGDDVAPPTTSENRTASGGPQQSSEDPGSEGWETSLQPRRSISRKSMCIGGNRALLMPIEEYRPILEDALSEETDTASGSKLVVGLINYFFTAKQLKDSLKLAARLSPSRGKDELIPALPGDYLDCIFRQARKIFEGFEEMHTDRFGSTMRKLRMETEL